MHGWCRSTNCGRDFVRSCPRFSSVDLTDRLYSVIYETERNTGCAKCCCVPCRPVCAASGCEGATKLVCSGRHITCHHTLSCRASRSRGTVTPPPKSSTGGHGIPRLPATGAAAPTRNDWMQTHRGSENVVRPAYPSDSRH
jgi:hypothetical protein